MTRIAVGNLLCKNRSVQGRSGHNDDLSARSVGLHHPVRLHDLADLEDPADRRREGPLCDRVYHRLQRGRNEINTLARMGAATSGDGKRFAIRRSS